MWESRFLLTVVLPYRPDLLFTIEVFGFSCAYTDKPPRKGQSLWSSNQSLCTHLWQYSLWHLHLRCDEPYVRNECPLSDLLRQVRSELLLCNSFLLLPIQNFRPACHHILRRTVTCVTLKTTAFAKRLRAMIDVELRCTVVLAECRSRLKVVRIKSS